MEPLKPMGEMGHEHVFFARDAESGYRAIVAVHDTTFGPALGGTRFWSYADEADALRDALRLSRGMTYKAVAAGLPFGGGKAVILREPGADREAVFRAHGRFVERLGGLYVTAEDVGTSVDDMRVAQRETRHVLGVAGDPSPWTAWGVFQGMRAALEEAFGSGSFEGRTVAVQGVGNVGLELARMLHEAGARLVVADVDPERVRRAVDELGAAAVGTDEIHRTACDVFAPCALGAVLHDASIPELRARVVAGAANNVLAEPRHGDELHRRGILYAPDYVVNAGGLISGLVELRGYSAEGAREAAGATHGTTRELLARARAEGIPPFRAADRMVEERLARARAEAPGGWPFPARSLEAVAAG